MSKPNPNYENSFWDYFSKWLKGEYDPSKGRLETKISDEKVHHVDRHLEDIGKYHEYTYEEGINRYVGRYRKVYRLMSVIIMLFMIGLLFWTVSGLPRFGAPHEPENNIVAERYIEKGLKETGAVNIVTGMILDYRAFDTFGESCVLFAASCCVLFLLRVDRDDDPHSAAVEEMNDRHYEPRNDAFLQKTADFLVPLILIFGIYVVLNGHLTPGGGFSGGAIIGSGLILYLTAHGFEKTQRFMNEKVVKVLTVCALLFYCFAKSYSFYTGANHLESFISTGTPGDILSAGLIVYLNICVGIVVACTMYSFYTLFRKGGI